MTRHSSSSSRATSYEYVKRVYRGETSTPAVEWLPLHTRTSTLVGVCVHYAQSFVLSVGLFLLREEMWYPALAGNVVPEFCSNRIYYQNRIMNRGLYPSPVC